MSVEISCEHCGHTYVAKANMAGKKVRCRNCGQVFVVNHTNAGNPAADAHARAGVGAGADAPEQQPDLGLPALEDLPQIPAAKTPYERNSDTTRVMPAIRTSESNMSGGIGSAKSMMERSGDPGTFDLAGGAAAAGFRPSKPFDFPFALEMDRFGPKAVLWLLLLWTAYIAFTWKPGLEENQHHPAWAGLIPAGVLLVLFAILWLPLFALAMRQVARAMKLALPPRHKTRAAALAALPFALSSVFWLAGESVGTLVTGVVLGVAIATPAAWFLYRLQEKEIPYAAVGLAIAGVVATAMSFGLYIGGNLLLNQTLIASGEDKLFIVSPMGPNLAWPAPERPPVVAARNPTTSRTALPSPTPEVVPQQPTLREVRGFTFDRAVDDILFAPGRNDIVGVVSKASDGAGQEISLYKVSAGSSSAAGKEIKWNKATLQSDAPAPFAPGDSCLSSDATRLARLVRVSGSVTVQVWSFETNKVIQSYRPSDWEPSDTIQLLRFDGNSNSRVICIRRQRGEFRPVTVDLGTLQTEEWYDAAQARAEDPQLLANKMNDRHGQMVALSPDCTMLAVTAVELQGTRSYLRIYTSTGKTKVFDHELGISAMKMALDPVGLAFSPDGSRAAVAYADQGRVSILTCPTAGSDRAMVAWSAMGGTTGSSSGEDRGEGAKARTNDLVWLAGGDHWLYGKTIADGPTQRFAGTVDVGQSTAQQTVFAGQQLMALINSGNGTGLVQATIIAAAPAEAAAPADKP